MGAGAPRFAVAGISQQLLVADAICKASVREAWAAENIRQRLEHLTSGLVLRPDAAAIATDCRKRSTLRFLSVQAVRRKPVRRKSATIEKARWRIRSIPGMV